jgi:hypothetical protein
MAEKGSSDASLHMSQAQRIRQVRETQDIVIDVVLSHDDRIAATERDVKVIKARLTDVEQRSYR